MKRITLMFLIFSLFCSCESAILNPSIEFITLNKSKSPVSWVTIFIQDTKVVDSRLSETGKPVEVASFTNIPVNEQSNLISVDLKKFSMNGNGNIYVLAGLKGSSDTLRNGTGSYANFRNTQEFAPKHWRTIEVIINSSANKKV